MNEHGLAEVLVPISVFAMVAAIVIAPILIRSRERQTAIDAIKRLAEQGTTPPPELMAIIKQTERPGYPDRDLKFGLIALAISAAMITMALVRFFLSTDPMPHIRAGLVGAAAFPGFIGLVLIGFWAFSRRERLDD